MEEQYLLPSLCLVEAVFTDYGNKRDGELVRSLVEEIRNKRIRVEGNPWNYRSRGRVV